jgi:S1-C subfamily serine protease
LLGLGVVLASGRVLTSLSSLGSGRELSVTFSDGDAGTVRVLRSHRGYDLALLGVDGANLPRRGLEVSLDGQRSRTLGFQGTRARAVRFDGTLVERVYGADTVEIDGASLSRRALPLGTPVVDDAGKLSGLAVLGCVPREGAPEGTGCRERDVVLPPVLIETFLDGAESADSVGWFGAGVELYDAGWLHALRVVSVEAGSPAQAANLQATTAGGEGDLIVALDGVPIGTPFRLYQTVMGLLPGSEVDVLLLRGGVFRHASVRLGAQPKTNNPWQLTPPLIQPPSPWFGY